MAWSMSRIVTNEGVEERGIGGAQHVRADVAAEPREEVVGGDGARGGRVLVRHPLFLVRLR